MNWHPNVTEFLAVQNFDQIINFYEQEIENNPDEINNYLYLGLAYFLSYKVNIAEEIWLETLLDINNIEENVIKLLTILRQEALNQLQKDQWQMALHIYRKIDELLSNQEQILPEYGLDYYNYGVILEKKGDKQTAFYAYQKAIKINPLIIDAYNNLGKIYFDNNQIEEAELNYRKAIEINQK
ncbi:tetratricopeptide repeat protein, partial [Geminocystis sp. GBBB08]|uniref:tetratricopeptide repeat protein n=1 Tax=Geminocystis sp. GBBB08 TaxID=2604140 RepID=UPI0027E38291